MARGEETRWEGSLEKRFERLLPERAGWQGARRLMWRVSGAGLGFAYVLRRRERCCWGGIEEHGA